MTADDRTPWRLRLRQYFEAFYDIWRQYWLVRWLVANSIGWSLALLLVGIAIQIGGGWGALMAWGLAGAVVGGAQLIALRTAPDTGVSLSGRNWVLMTMLGGATATLPLYGLALLLLLNQWLVGALMGLVVGASIGYMQYRLLRDEVASAHWWWWANIVGAVLCAPLTLQMGLWGLPVFLSPGLLIFGWLTGWAWFRMQEDGGGGRRR